MPFVASLTSIQPGVEDSDSIIDTMGGADRYESMTAPDTPCATAREGTPTPGAEPGIGGVPPQRGGKTRGPGRKTQRGRGQRT
jgi:hypothetical protein